MAGGMNTGGPIGPAESIAPSVVGATEGAGIAVGANAQPLYAQGLGAGNNSAKKRKRASLPAVVTFRGSAGQLWGFDGKIGRVLHMLATMPQGVTQWDTLPWHTRLGASIHSLREAGLSIRTQREGDCRHARYFLLTPGRLTGPSGGAI